MIWRSLRISPFLISLQRKFPLLFKCGYLIHSWGQFSSKKNVYVKELRAELLQSPFLRSLLFKNRVRYVGLASVKYSFDSPCQTLTTPVKLLPLLVISFPYFFFNFSSIVLFICLFYLLVFVSRRHRQRNAIFILRYFPTSRLLTKCWHFYDCGVGGYQQC